MSRTIDDKVVEMQFDNAQFERGVKETMSTLEKLKRALDMSPLVGGIEAVQVKFSAFDAFMKRTLENIADNAYNTGKRLIKSLSVDQIGRGWEKFGDKTAAVQTIMAATAQTWEESANVMERANRLMERGLDSGLANDFAKRYNDVANGLITVEEASEKLGVSTSYFQDLSNGLDDVTYAGAHAGGQMDYVSDQLARLNWFTDETSYSFMDMVNNIGKFTSNSIPLDRAVTSMQGISTWAAISGANVSEAGRAMYNLSQAIGVGAVKLQDWKSIENANMATAEFKQIAIDTAVELGTLVEVGEGLYNTLDGNEVSVRNFNEALKDAWFSSDVLLKTLDKYGGFSVQMNAAAEATGLTAKELLDYTHAFKEGTFDIEEALSSIHESEEYAELSTEDLHAIISGLADDSNELGMKAFEAAQSAKTFNDVIEYVKEAVSTGWMNTFELVFGNFEEAKKLWSDLAEEMYDIFVESGDLRNEMLRAWKEDHGRDDVIEAFWNIFHVIKGIISAVKGAFREIFPAMTAERLKSITEKLRDFSRVIAITDEETGELNERGEKIKTTFQGLFSVLKLLKDVAAAVIKPIKNLFAGAGEGILNLGASFGELLLKYTSIVQESGILEQITIRLGGVFSALHDFIGNVLEIFRGVSYWEGGGGIAGIFESIFDGINNVVRLFFDVFSSLAGKDLSTVRDKVMDVIRNVRDFIVDGLGPVSDILIAFKNKIAEAIKATKDSFSGFNKVDMSGPESFKTKISKIFGPLISLFEGLKNIFLAVWEGVKKLAPLISAAVTLLGKVLSKIGSSIVNVVKNADASNLLDLVNSGTMVAIGIGLAKFIGKLKDVGESLGGIKDVFKSLTGFFDGMKESFVKKAEAEIILKIAAAVAILAISAYALSSVDPDALTTSIEAISVLLTELVLAMRYVSKLNMRTVKKGATTLVALSAAVLILAAAVKKLSGLKWEELAVGLVGVTVLLGEMVIAAKVLSDKHSKKMIKGAANVVVFAAAIYILASAAKSLSDLSWEELAKGLVGITALVAEMVIAAKVISSGDNNKMLKGAANVVIFAAAIRVLVSSVKSLAKMDTDSLIQGMIGVGVLIVEIVAAAKILASGENGGEKMLVGAANALVFAAALRLLVASVKAIGSLNVDILTQGLIGVGVLMGEMAVAAKIMAGSGSGAAAMIATAAALLILGAAMKLIATLSWEDVAKGIITFAGFLLSLGAVAFIIAPVVPYILALAAAMALIGVSAIGFGAGLLAISAALTAFSLVGEVAFSALVKGIEILITAIPKLISALAKSLADSIESLTSLVITIGLSIIEAIKELIPKATEVLLEVILSVLRSLANNIRPIVEALIDIVVGAIEGLAAGVPKIVAASAELIKEIVQSLLDAFGSFNLRDILEATAILVALDAAVALVAVLAVEAVAATATLPIIGRNLSRFGKSIEPFLKTISKYDASSLQGAAALGDLILSLTASNILDSLTSWFTGGNSLEKFGAEIESFGPHIKAYSDSVRGINSNNVKKSAEAAKALTDFADSIPNTGGLVAKITGDNSLSKFAFELAVFGPIFAKYAKSMERINPDVVVASSSAAETVSAFAKGLPKRGGLVGLITGNNSLSDFAKELYKFGPAFAQYAGYMTKVNYEVVTASSAAAETVTTFANKVPKSGGLVSLITGDNSLADFAEELKAFGKPFVAYANQMALIKNVDAVTASSAAAESIAKFASIVPPSGGIVQLVTGENDLGEFAEALVKFGPAMKIYAKSVDGLSFESVELSAGVASTMAAAAASLPTSGGVKSWFSGETSLQKFGESLASFGPNFAIFVGSIKDVEGLDVAENAAAIVSKMAEAAANLPEQKNDIDAWLFGDASLSKFGEELVKFGPNFAEYAAKTKGITAYKLKGSSEALLLVAQAAAALPEHGGVKSWFVGDATLSTFGQELEDFGGKFSAYAATISGVSYDKLEIAVASIDALVKIANALPVSGGVMQWIEGEYNLKDFGDSLEIFGARFKLYGDHMADTNLEAISSSLDLVKQVFNILPEDYEDTYPIVDMGDALVHFGDVIIEFAGKMLYLQESMPGYQQVFTSVFSDIQDVVNQLISTDVSSLNNFSSALAEIAENMYVKFAGVFSRHKIDLVAIGKSFAGIVVEEVLKKTDDFIEAGKSMSKSFTSGIVSVSLVDNWVIVIDNCIKYIKSTRYRFEDAGKYLVEGFSNGMTSNSQTSKDAAAKVGASALKGLNNSLQVKSPSKKAYQSGKYVILGFSKALIAGIPKIRADAASVGFTAIDELSKDVASMAAIVADDIETSPVIRPVLDLSDIQAGANNLDAIFSRKQAFAIGTNGADDYFGSINGTSRVVQFNQYNYSPKALNPVEIYRQTNNQLSRYR